jgi:hypothetical protein
VLERKTPPKNDKRIEMRRRKGKQGKRANGRPRGKEGKKITRT